MKRRKENKHLRLAALAGALVLLFGALLITGVGARVAEAFVRVASSIVPADVSFTRGGEDTDVLEPKKPSVRHVETPSAVKSIYMSQCVVGTPTFRDTLVELVDTTELNSIIIDIRDYTGKISFPTDHPLLADSVSDACGARDMKAFIERLHEKNIYVIGRITVFQNPYYTSKYPEQAVQKKGGGVWKDHKGLAFVDVGAREYWDSVVALAKEAHAIGFDEINFDYIRYPSDGNMAEAVYRNEGKSKPEMLEEFFKYLHDKLAPSSMVTSADIFGMTTTNTDDLNIGQVLERTLPYFDYVAPMVYPSHYPKGFHGYENVNAHTYDIIHFSMSEAVRRAIATTTGVDGLAQTRIGTSTPALYAKPSYDKQKLRPWLQSFDYPVEYTPEMVRSQIQASYDVGLTSWFFWDPANKYRSLKAVLTSE